LVRLQSASPERKAKFTIAPNLAVAGDQGLLRVALENLLGNAWKVHRGKPQTVIELGMEQRDREKIYFVRDNGVGSI